MAVDVRTHTVNRIVSVVRTFVVDDVNFETIETIMFISTEIRDHETSDNGKFSLCFDLNFNKEKLFFPWRVENLFQK